MSESEEEEEEKQKGNTEETSLVQEEHSESRPGTKRKRMTGEINQEEEEEPGGEGGKNKKFTKLFETNRRSLRSRGKYSNLSISQSSTLRLGHAELTEILSESDFWLTQNYAEVSTLNWLIFEWVTKPFVSDFGHGKNLRQFSVAKQLLSGHLHFAAIFSSDIVLTPKVGALTYCLTNFPENCMKMKKFWLRRGTFLVPPWFPTGLHAFCLVNACGANPFSRFLKSTD